MDMTITERMGRIPVTVLHLNGDLDASNFQDLIATAHQLYDDGARALLLDLSDAAYLSSSGLVALQSIAALFRGSAPADVDEGRVSVPAIDRNRDRGTQVSFKLVNPQPRVEHVLEMVGFVGFLEVHRDLDEAVSSF